MKRIESRKNVLAFLPRIGTSALRLYLPIRGIYTISADTNKLYAILLILKWRDKNCPVI